MRIPETVRIGPYWYDVERGVERLMGRDKVDLIGEADHDQLTIRLAAGFPRAIEEAALFHEVIHAINDICQLEIEEKHTIVLASMLYAFLRDNDLLKEGGEA